MINIVLISDSKYFEGLLCTVGCIMLTNKSYPLKFYVIDNGIKQKEWQRLKELVDKNKCQLEHITVSPEIFINAPGMYGSHSLYFKLLLGSLLDCDKVIYIDTDMLIFKDLLPLWEMNLNENIIAASVDYKQTLRDDLKPESLEYVDPRLLTRRYVNTGFMLIDLKAWRKQNVESKFFDILKNKKIKYCQFDQSIINIALADKTIALDKTYNRFIHKIQDINELLEFNENIHYVLKEKPWNKFVLFNQGFTNSIVRLLWREAYTKTVSRFPFYFSNNKIVFELFKLSILETPFVMAIIKSMLRFVAAIGISKPYAVFETKFAGFLNFDDHNSFIHYKKIISNHFDNLEKQVKKEEHSISI